MKDTTILVIDDEEILLSSISEYLENYNLKTCSNPVKALNELRNTPCDILIVDYKMPGMTGIELLLEAKRLNAYRYGILFTAYADKDMLEKALNREIVSRLIEKPLKLKEFQEIVDHAIGECRRSRQAELKLERYEALVESLNLAGGQIVGLDRGLKQVFRQVQSVARHQVNVMLTGETGTGKEVIARLVHNLSPRREHCFVAVNCAAIPSDLLESELFGYEKGAFTGALAPKSGKIELAQEGTLFLDEIGDLKPELQAKLLRVIQEKRVERLGSLKGRELDFRLITATNISLETAVAGKLFREDLYYRIGTFPIHLPPLRKRKEDIEALARFYLAKYSKELNLKTPALAADVIPALQSYHWPGNIRELTNALQRALLTAASEEKPELTAGDFGFLFFKTGRGAERASVFQVLRDMVIDKSLELDAIEGEVLNAILGHYEHNITRAARETGISRAKFYRNRNESDPPV